ncbi:MAG: thioredoxin [Oscillospiraceae bacterium]|nr:thioredoxin [Oscillospiraceae bacterium]MCC8156962.1 thioredoxin [Oscillospiraceae bacterium]MCD7767478.1 thioredoxin [Oscillospiraceae bacterium]MCD7903905.1 thioredoxin [Oscillospiraceae bacterium]MCD8240445.1 thioredoxin [Oscillospiraceae bacterium]
MTKEITRDNFETEVLRADTPVLLDFWASWCGPCRMLSPVVDELSEEYSGKIMFGKVNVDEQPELAAAYRVRSIPTLIYFKSGEVMETSVGVVPKDEIEKMFC